MAGRGVHGLEHVCLAKLVQIGDGLVFKIRVLLFFQKLQVCHALMVENGAFSRKIDNVTIFRRI